MDGLLNAVQLMKKASMYDVIFLLMKDNHSNRVSSYYLLNEIRMVVLIGKDYFNFNFWEIKSKLTFLLHVFSDLLHC